jgi:hypothetical protein
MKWKILDTKEVNAVAVPGGFMYVTRGLLDLDPRPSDDELAFVIGHETAHISKRHSMDQLEKNLGWAIVIAVLAKGSTAQFVGDLAQQLLASGYSRSDEREADDGGFKYMVDAGYDPRGAVSFMRRLMALSRGSAPPKIFASHPPSKERLNNMQRRLEKLGLTQAYLEPAGDGYRLTEAAFAEIKSIALQPTDLEDIPDPPAPRAGGIPWALLQETPTREALLRYPPTVGVPGMRQEVRTSDGEVAVAVEYVVFDTPEAAHWALASALLHKPVEGAYEPTATTEADELWQSPAPPGYSLIFRKGEVVVAMIGKLAVSDGDRLVTAIARRIAMPAPTTELEGAPTLITADALLAGAEYADVRDDTIGLSTDGWRALGVEVTIEGDRVTLSREARSITVRVKSDKAEADGEEVVLEARTWAVNHRVYIPVETVGERLGLSLIAAPESALVALR